MVGEAAKPSKPLIARVPHQPARRFGMMKPLATLFALVLLGGLIYLLSGRLRLSSAYERVPASIAPTTGYGSRADDGRATTVYPGSQESAADARPSSRRAPTDESFLATFATSKKTKLPNISGDCVVSGAKGHSLDDCLRQQMKD